MLEDSCEGCTLIVVPIVGLLCVVRGRRVVGRTFGFISGRMPRNIAGYAATFVIEIGPNV